LEQSPLTSDGEDNAARVRSYLAALEAGVVGDELARFFTRDALQIELPNRLNPEGQRSDLESILDRALKGRGLLSSQKFDIVSEVAYGDRVAVEAHWTGVIAVPVGGLAAGSEMRAHFAMFFEFRKGRIHRQRNYDCFEPW
jgi:ketosteroid isomerase-like protein